MSQSPDRLTFSIDSRLLEELGENLVTRNHVAMAELIKNAYDADATEVEISFINSRQQKGNSRNKIRIKDDGVGMTPAEIENNWMRIGTTNKIRNPRTAKYGRKKTGDKGIGRFSCRRLANQLELTSIAEDPDSNGYVKTKVSFDWARFERDTNVDSVPVPVEIEYLDAAKTGVTLNLIDLRDEWTQRDFNTLRRNVLTLSVVQQQRRGEKYEEDPGFEIEFDAPEFEKGQGTLLEQVYDAGWGLLEGRVDESGNVSLQLDAKKIGERSYTLRKGYEGIKGSTFKIAFIPGRKKHFRDSSTLSLERANEITDDYGGIRVYQDGFRVYPYGGPSDDWLSIARYSARRSTRPDKEFDDLSGSLDFHKPYDRTMLLHPRNENLFGRVNVDSDANLGMKADREGFKENDSFQNLREGIQLSLQWLTLQYSNYQSIIQKEKLQKETAELEKQIGKDRPKSSKSKPSTSSGYTSSTQSKSSHSSTSSMSSTQGLNQAVSVLRTASENIKDRTEPEEGSSVSTDAVETAANIVENSVEQKQKEIDFYRSAFSVNQFIFSFMHELRDMILELENLRGDIKYASKGLPRNKQDEFQGIAAEVNDLRKRFEQQMNLFGVLTDAGDTAEKEKFQLTSETDELLDAVNYITNIYEVTTENNVPDTLYTPPILQTELYSILVNLVTNSIKAVIASSGTKRKIAIDGEESDDGITIRVHDTGIGIPSGYRDDVMNPLVSDPANELYDRLDDELPNEISSQLGTGSGLGLSIVSEIAQKYNGSVSFVDMEPWEATVEVELNE